jgi:hypothetical protein
MTQAQICILFNRIREIRLALPEAKEVEAWGHATFRAPKKKFSACGAERDGSASLGLKVGFDRQEKLLKDPRFFPTPYAGRQGWVAELASMQMILIDKEYSPPSLDLELPVKSRKMRPKDPNCPLLIPYYPGGK